MSKRNGGDKRGSAEDRRKRKRWLLVIFGDGTTAPCTHCGLELTYATLEQDRIIPGGSYARHNIQPSCAPCNILRGDRTMEQFKASTAGEAK
jgi:hypothetical protein